MLARVLDAFQSRMVAALSGTAVQVCFPAVHSKGSLALQSLQSCVSEHRTLPPCVLCVSRALVLSRCAEDNRRLHRAQMWKSNLHATVQGLAGNAALARLMAAEPAASQAGEPVAFFAGRSIDSIDAFVTEVVNAGVFQFEETRLK